MLLCFVNAFFVSINYLSPFFRHYKSWVEDDWNWLNTNYFDIFYGSCTTQGEMLFVNFYFRYPKMKLRLVTSFQRLFMIVIKCWSVCQTFFSFWHRIGCNFFLFQFLVKNYSNFSGEKIFEKGKNLKNNRLKIWIEK